MKIPRIPGPDRYEFNARLRPALWAVLPALVLPAVWLPEVWTALGGIATLLATCGATFLMAQISRQGGRRLQARMSATLGPHLTAIMLSHGDAAVDPLTKARYHTFLRGQGLKVPTPEEETADPSAALVAYRSCATWLLAATRDKKRFYLLAEENIAYGYRRNLRALRPIALPLVVAAFVVNAGALWSLWPTTDARFWTGATVEVGMSLVIAGWLLVVNDEFVADASRAFADRLLAACDELAAKKPNKAKVTAA